MLCVQPKHMKKLNLISVLKVKVSVAQLCPTLRSHGLYYARLLCAWGFSRQEYWSGEPFPLGESSQPRDQTQVSCTAGRFFTF